METASLQSSDIDDLRQAELIDSWVSDPTDFRITMVLAADDLDFHKTTRVAVKLIQISSKAVKIGVISMDMFNKFDDAAILFDRVIGKSSPINKIPWKLTTSPLT